MNNQVEQHEPSTTQQEAEQAREKISVENVLEAVMTIPLSSENRVSSRILMQRF